MYGSFFNVEVDGKLKKNKSLTDIFAWKDNPSLRIVTSKKRLTFEELMAIPEIQRAGGAIRKGTPAAFRNLAPRACNPQTAGRLGTEDGQEEEQGAVGGGLPVISMVSYDVMDELSERAAQKAAQLQEERSKVEGGPASLQRELDMAERGRCIPLQEGGRWTSHRTARRPARSRRTDWGVRRDAPGPERRGRWGEQGRL